MAYSTPPTFSDGSIASASQFNILSDDLEFLKGRIVDINVPFRGAIFTGTYDDTDAAWRMVHFAQYLHYRLRLTTSDANPVELWVNGSKEWEDTTTRSAPYTYSGYLDLDVDPGGLTLGVPYSIHFEGTFPGGAPRTLIVDYLIESDSTTL